MNRGSTMRVNEDGHTETKGTTGLMKLSFRRYAHPSYIDGSYPNGPRLSLAVQSEQASIPLLFFKYTRIVGCHQVAM